MDRKGYWTFEGFEFWILVEFCFHVHIDGDMGTTQGKEFLEFEDIHIDTFLVWE
jgi:hypothetical protein